MTLFAPILISFLAALFATALVRRYALRALLDVPNERSSHTVPTPRGGGLAIGIVFLAAMAVLAAAGTLPVKLALAFIGGGAAVMIIGWLDDHRPLSARLRIVVHIVAGIWAVACVGGVPEFTVGRHVLSLGWLGHVLAVVGVVWMINLYNFMDGIDGLAAGEAVTVALVMAGLLWFVGAADLALVAGLFAAACGGFLWWNWQPAKIFLGDVGSGLLGYCFAVLVLASEKAGAVPLTVSLLLLAVFVLDATCTLIGRVVRGEKWYTAHRTHAYQRLTQNGFSHAQVTTAAMLVNVLLLAPLAALVVYRPGWVGPVLAGVMLLGWLIWKVLQRSFGKSS